MSKADGTGKKQFYREFRGEKGWERGFAWFWHYFWAGSPPCFLFELEWIEDEKFFLFFIFCLEESESVEEKNTQRPTKWKVYKNACDDFFSIFYTENDFFTAINEELLRSFKEKFDLELKTIYS